MKKEKHTKKYPPSQHEIGLYVHIPFCRSKCYYCDFNSFASRERQIVSYMDALIKEIEKAGEKTGNCIVKTVFIGGGTPSLVEGSLIKRLLLVISNSFTLMENAEISMEANPGTMTREKLCHYRESGINRLSIGLQAAQEHLLKRLGRTHSWKDFQDVFYLARHAGFDNINVDIMFGIPDQRMVDWQKTIDSVLAIAPEHISAYGLKIEEGTVFGDLQQKRQLADLDDDLEREMYYYANRTLAQEGYQHYEISNYAQRGRACRHNLIYWKAEEYLGFGAGAHSYFNGVRYCNGSGINQYIEAILQETGSLIVEQTEIGLDEQRKEFMMLGLRLLEGVTNKAFQERFGEEMFQRFGDTLRVLAGKGLLLLEGETVRLSSRGLDFANQVFMEFV